MMVDEPEKYITDLKQAGADIVGVHLEATPHIHRVLSQIKASGLKSRSCFKSRDSSYGSS